MGCSAGWRTRAPDSTFWTRHQRALTDCRRLLLCQVSSRLNCGFQFYRANIPTHTPTHTHTHRDKVITLSAPPYCVVGADDNNCYYHFQLSFFSAHLLQTSTGQPDALNVFQNRIFEDYWSRIILRLTLFLLPTIGAEALKGMILQTKWIKRSERRKHCTLAVVRQSRAEAFCPATDPLPGGTRQPKSNQLEMVTTFTYKPSLVRIDARNFELSW